MNKYRLIVDSSCDFPAEFYTKYNIGVTDLIVNFNERQYVDRKEINSREIIKIAEETNVLPKTSALNIPELEEVFTRELKDYEHIFYMPISSYISSINNNAHLAVQDLGIEDKVTILDSLSLSSGVALQAIGIGEDILHDLSVEKIIQNHEKRTKKVSMSFVIDRLDYLYKGGRCSGMTYFFGSKFDLHPIIRLDDGKMGVHALTRGKNIKKGVKKMFDEFKEEWEKGNIDLSYPVFLPNVLAEGYVDDLKKDLIDLIKSEKIVYPVDASGIICCHCGRCTLGIGYMLKSDLK